MSARVAWRRLALLVGFVGAVSAADPGFYIRRGSWHDTLLDARLGLTQASGGTGAPQMSVWQAAGPFFGKDGKSSFATLNDGEAAPDVTRAYDNGRGTPLRFKLHPEYADGEVHDLVPAADVASTMLVRTITVPAACRLKVFLGSDDGLIVYCNGQRVLANDVPRGAGPNQDTCELDLKAGENQLVLKVCNQGGGHGFYFSTSETPVNSAAAVDGLFALLRRDFTDPAAQRQIAWEQADGLWRADFRAGDFASLARRYAQATPLPALQEQASQAAATVKDAAGLWRVADLYHEGKRLDDAQTQLTNTSFKGLRASIEHLARTYGARYPQAPALLARVTALEAACAQRKLAPAEIGRLGDELAALKRTALVDANPLLDFAKLMYVKRRGPLGLPQNWQANTSIPLAGYETEIATLDLKDGSESTLYKPPGGRFVGDLDLHFDGRKLLFSSQGKTGRWAVLELGLDGGEPVEVTPTNQPDINFFTACYLPDERVIFSSDACLQGVPCVGGGDRVALLYLLDRRTQAVRQLTFDQDQSWYPHLLNNGRVVYTRWEYSDTAHYFTRIVFSMNPDGTDQRELFGSNSYWPNSTFYTRPIPGDPNKVVAVISGHHGVPRMGELLLFDPAQGRREASGAVQRIPGWNKPVEPKIEDQLVNNSWPKFLHPLPLSDTYFLVSAQLKASEPWALYLVDTYDNFVLLKQDSRYNLFEPLPWRATQRPPVIPDKVDPQRKDATIYVADIYSGPGLRGVPRGTVKSLRVYSNQFAFVGMGGHINIGIDGPWDAKRILGTVPVEADGSAMFNVPANVPIIVQPLDAEGKALQVMRSWMTAMPGEMLSCVGCHETQSITPTQRKHTAALKAPREITPWYGPARPFSFRREVQPVLDKFCVGCHDGAQPAAKLDLRDTREPAARGFSPAYLQLHRFVRRPGPESDYHLQPTAEFHADTSELVQLLQKGHHNVALDPESWDRLITWIDLNVPCLGTWSDERAIPGNYHQRRNELRKLYANLDEDWEAQAPLTKVAATPVLPTPAARPAEPPLECPDWPFDAATAKAKQAALGETRKQLDLGGGVRLELVKVPAGEFVMGDAAGEDDERPRTRQRVDRAFWIGRCLVTNQQFARFDAEHDSRYISETNKDQSRRGIPVNGPLQPVVRVSWQQATAFCAWLSARSGLKVSLPSELEYEWAARAGTSSPFWWGGVEGDFSKAANLADTSCVQLARANSPKWAPREDKYNDGSLVTNNVDRYQPNPFGLQDMIGNAWEWTRSTYQPYPYRADDGREQPSSAGRKVCRGGSWFDRPQRARVSFRLSYPSWQPVYNVGFRVICEDR